MSVAAIPTYFVHGEFLIANDGTGEIIGAVALDGSHILYEQEKGPWMPTDEEGALWYMRKRGELLMDIKARKAERERILANMDAQIRKAEKDLERFDQSFKEIVTQLARTFLTKSKTWVTPYGSISFKSSKDRLSVVSEEKAIRWANEECKEAVFAPDPQPKFYISDVPAELKAELMELPVDELAELGFTVIPGGEKAEVNQ